MKNFLFNIIVISLRELYYNSILCICNLKSICLYNIRSILRRCRHRDRRGPRLGRKHGAQGGLSFLDKLADTTVNGSVYRSAANDNNISLGAKGVMYSILKQSSSHKGQVSDLISNTFSSGYAVSKFIKELADAGYVKRKFDKQDGLFTGSHYVVCDEISRPSD